MKSSKKSLKNSGYILPTILFVVSILTWLFSMSLLNYKSEVDNFSLLKNSNESYWIMENLSTIAEYEVLKGNRSVENDEYKDIIEYFEDKNLIWIDSDEVSKSGYKRVEVKHNEKFVENRLELIPYTKNILDIKLIKTIDIENNQVEVKINLFYEYLLGESDFFKSYKREIRGVEARLQNENIGN